MPKSPAERQAARRRKLQREGARQYLVTLPKPAADKLEALRKGRTVSETFAAIMGGL